VAVSSLYSIKGDDDTLSVRPNRDERCRARPTGTFTSQLLPHRRLHSVLYCTVWTTEAELLAMFEFP